MTCPLVQTSWLHWGVAAVCQEHQRYFPDTASSSDTLTSHPMSKRQIAGIKMPHKCFHTQRNSTYWDVCLHNLYDLQTNLGMTLTLLWHQLACLLHLTVQYCTHQSLWEESQLLGPLIHPRFDGSYMPGPGYSGDVDLTVVKKYLDVISPSQDKHILWVAVGQYNKLSSLPWVLYLQVQYNA